MQIPIPGIIINGPQGPRTLELGEPRGGGAFGVVFKAVDLTDGSVFAVKFPQSAVFGGNAELAAFFNEVSAAQEIRHPNVVKIVHVETQPDELPPYLVMEFIAGGTLQSVLTRISAAGQQVDVDHLRLWATGLIEGIAAINEKMLHRDLKPNNILMDGDVPKISDFGLSKIVGALTRTMTFKGGQHILYMAPEGWRLETNTIQLDMYAMGIVLFEMATLQYPYDRPSDLRDLDAIRTMHFFSSPHTVTSLRPDLPIGFTHVVTRLLEKRAQDRFASWVEVADALSKVWEQCGHPNARLSSVVQALLEETSRQHQQLTQNRLEQKAADVTRKQQREIDVFQQHKLFSAIQEVIQEFNSHSALGSISASSGGRVGGALSFYVKLPFDSTIQLDFFWIDPPLELKQGSVRFAGVVVGPRGYGYNYLLVRSGVTDIYGRWVICKVRQSAIVDPRKLPPRHEPFGFNNSSTIREIETAERAIHIYTVTFEEASADCFLQFALEIMRSWLPS